MHYVSKQTGIVYTIHYIKVVREGVILVMKSHGSIPNTCT